MNSKIKLLAVASMVAIMASGCSSYRGASQAGTNVGASTKSVGAYAGGQVARTGQVARGGFGQQRAGTAAVVHDSCAACAASKAQSTYTYKPAKPVVQAPRPAAVQRPVVQQKPVQRNNQQYYIDRWNRQQQQQQQRPAPRVVQQQQQQATNYAGYGQNNTTYVDYSTAAQTTAPAPKVAATSNKSIYTGSYQQKTYAPTTYSGGSSATTNSGSAYANAKASIASTGGGGGSTYSVKKGDTVFEIMRQTGVYWKDIISMNNLSPPYNINPGQTLRLK